MLEALAEKYAHILGTTVLSSKEHDGAITFVLATGPKLTMTPASLQRKLEEAGVTPDALPRHTPGLLKAIEASGVTEAELIQALDESQGIPPRQSQPGPTKPTPPAQAEAEPEADKPKRKPRTK